MQRETHIIKSPILTKFQADRRERESYNSILLHFLRDQFWEIGVGDDGDAIN